MKNFISRLVVALFVIFTFFGQSNVALAAPALRDIGPGGGYIFYIAPDGLSGMEAAPSDQGQVQWGCDEKLISGADGTAIGTGKQNTADIWAGCATAGIAARVASTTINGYSDWFLPSKDELNKMYVNLKKGLDENGVTYTPVGGFTRYNYWSSSEGNSNYAWDQNFYNGDQGNYNKNYSQYVRAVRAFTITPPPPPSALSYPSPQTYTAGAAIATLSPTVEGGAVAEYSVSPALPTGLSLNTSTGDITGTPTVVTPTTNYTVTATNSGGFTTFDVSITVNAPLPTDYDITNIVLSGSPTGFTYSPSVYTYSGLTVASDVSSITVTPTYPISDGVVYVYATPVGSNETSQPITLDPGVLKTITIFVRVAGMPVRTYTIDVTRDTAAAYTPESCFGFSAGTITSYTYNGATCGYDVNIPPTIGGVSVTSIGDYAFEKKQITSVTIPDSVTSVGYRAFYTNLLTSVIIPDSVTTIGNAAFTNNLLTSVTISSSVTFLGHSLFSNNLLTSVTIPDGVTIIDNFAFSNNLLTNVIIPDSVTSIRYGAFLNNQLASVTIGTGVTSIGHGAFSDNQITSVVIPDSVTTIDDRAFSYNQLTSVTIGTGVTSIGNIAFSNNQITSVVIPDSVTTIGDSAFIDNQLTSVTIGTGVTSIGHGAFSDNQITSVVIPDSVTSIGEYAFNGNWITEVIIGDGVTIDAGELWWFPAMGFYGASFKDFYDNTNSQLAGIYSYINGAWYFETTDDVLARINAGDEDFVDFAKVGITNATVSLWSNYQTAIQLARIAEERDLDLAEVQAVITAVNDAAAIALAKINAGTEETLPDYATAGITDATADKLLLYRTAILDARTEKGLPGGPQDLTLEEVQAVVNQVNALARINAGDEEFTDYALAGVEDAIEPLLLNYHTAVAAAIVSNGGLDLTLGGLQFVVDTVNDAATAALARINVGIEETFPDFATAGVAGAIESLWLDSTYETAIQAARLAKGGGVTPADLTLAEVQVVIDGYTSESCFGFSAGIITSYTYNGTTCGYDVSIPPTIGGVNVTSIGTSAFYNKQLTSIKIPYSVTSIGVYAFSHNQLSILMIPTSVTNIGNYAFEYNQLSSLTIPNSVTTIGNAAFEKNRLTSVTIPNSVTSIGGGAFMGNQLTSVTIPDGMVSTGDWTFADNLLTSVTIPDSVTSIGPFAFANNHLTNIIIPSSVTSVGNFAFINNFFTSVIIPDSVTSIGQSAFEGNDLTSIVIGGNVVLFSYNLTMGAYGGLFNSFYDNNSKLAGTYTYINGAWYFGTPEEALARINAGDEEFSDFVLAGIENANELFWSNYQTAIQLARIAEGGGVAVDLDLAQVQAVITAVNDAATAALARINAGTEETFPDFATAGVVGAIESLWLDSTYETAIQAARLEKGGGLTPADLTLAEVQEAVDGVNPFTRDIFFTFDVPTQTIIDYDVAGGLNVRIPPVITVEGVPYDVLGIGDNVFYFKQITSVTIPEGVTSIGQNAFYGNELIGVTVPNSVTSIGDWAFGNNQLTSAVISSFITSIGQGAFYYNQLTSVIIPDGVTSIGDYSFANNLLASVIIPDSVTSIGNYSFNNNQLVSLIIPNSVTSIGSGAFAGNYLTLVTIPNSVTFIDSNAFASNQLTTITIGGNVAISYDSMGTYGEAFQDFYDNSNSQLAGTYTYINGSWYFGTPEEALAKINASEEEFSDYTLAGVIDAMEPLWVNSSYQTAIQAAKLEKGSGVPVDLNLIEVQAVIIAVNTANPNLSSIVAYLPQGLSELSCATATDGKIYCFGGLNDFGGLDSITVYDPANPTTEAVDTGALLPSPKNGLSCAASDNGKIYCFGGMDGNIYDVSGEILEYNPTTPTVDPIITSAVLPNAVVGLSCVTADNGKIYCFGGSGGRDAVDNITEYNPASPNSSPSIVAHLPSADDFHSCSIAVNGKIYCFDKGAPVFGADIIEYDPSNPFVDATLLSSVLPLPMNSLSCSNSAADNKIYCFGGQDQNYSSLNQIIQFDPLSPNTDPIVMSSFLSIPRHSLSCSMSDFGSIYCFGGYNSSTGTYLDEIVQYEIYPLTPLQKINLGTESFPDYDLAGVTGAVEELWQNYKLAIQAQKTTLGRDLDLAEVQAEVTAVNDAADLALARINTGDESFSDFATAGVADVIEGFWPDIYRDAIAQARTDKLPDESELSRAEVQAVIDAVNILQMPAALARINAGTETFPDFAIAGVTGAIELNKLAYDALIAIAKANKGSDLTREEVQTQVDAINSGPWTTNGEGGTARFKHTSEVYNGNIYYIGGQGGISGGQNTVNIYNIASGTWSVGTPGGTGRFNHVSVLDETTGLIYIWGGGSNSSTLYDTVDVYDPSGNGGLGSWEMDVAEDPSPISRFRPAAVLYGGNMYIWGGYDNLDTGAPVDTMEIYNLDNGTWSTGLSGGVARYNHTAILSGDNIYFLGGTTDSNSGVTTVDIYNITGNSWSTGSDWTNARFAHTSVVYNGKIYSWGGIEDNNAETAFNTMDVYDISVNSWSAGISGGTGRFGHTSNVSNGKMYAWGGAIDNNPTKINTMDIFDFNISVVLSEVALARINAGTETFPDFAIAGVVGAIESLWLDSSYQTAIETETNGYTEPLTLSELQDVIDSVNSGYYTDESCFGFNDFDGRITSYTYNGTTCGSVVNIPPTIGGQEVSIIGYLAFNNEQVTSITIPNSVYYIQEGAFTANEITRITIGANVSIYQGEIVTMGNYGWEFEDLYNNNGQLAGTYNYIDGVWILGSPEDALARINEGEEEFSDYDLAGVEDAVVELWSNYQTAIQLARIAEGRDLDLAEVQAVITAVNDAAALALARINSNTETFPDFRTAGVRGAIGSLWESDYKPAIDIATDGYAEPLTLSELQGVIDQVNVERFWTVGGEGGTARMKHTENLYNGKIYYIGGQGGISAGENTIDIYEPNAVGEKWTTGTSGGEGRFNHVSFLDETTGKIYIWGGTVDSSMALDTMDVYTIDGGWETSTTTYNTPIGVFRPTATQYGRNVYVWGGIDIDQWTTTNEMNIFNLDNNTWTVAPDINNNSIARFNHTAILSGDNIYFLGGDDVNYNPISTVDIYNITGNSWTTGADWMSARFSHSSVLHDGKIYSWGGTTDNAPTTSNIMNVYDIENNSWSLGIAGGTNRMAHTSTVYDGKMYAWGGMDDNKDRLNSMDIFEIPVDAPLTTPLERINQGTETFPDYNLAGVTDAIEDNWLSGYKPAIQTATSNYTVPLDLSEIQTVVTQVNALARINAGEETFPDFETAGVIGAVEDNMEEYDLAVIDARWDKGGAELTLSEVQSLVNRVNRDEALRRINEGTETFPDFETAGVVGAIEDLKSVYDKAISDASSLKGDSLTLEEVQGEIDRVNLAQADALARINNGDEFFPDFELIGTEGAIEANWMPNYKTAISDAKALKGSDLNASEIQTVINEVNAIITNSLKAITSFIIPGGVFSINENEHTITVDVPFGTDVTTLTPTIVHTGASILPDSGVVQNFTDPVTYTVTAIDTTTQKYTVTVNTLAPGVKTISGQLKYYDNAKNIIVSEVILEDEIGTVVATTSLDVNGGYQFSSATEGNNYKVRAIRPSTMLPAANLSSNGINSADLTTIRRVISGAVILDSEYKKIAADMVPGGVGAGIRSNDLVKLRGTISGRFPVEWRFFLSDAPVTLADHYLSTSNKESSFTPIVGDAVEQNYIGIKVGDLNNSWSSTTEASRL